MMLEENEEDVATPEMLQYYADNNFTKTYSESNNPFHLPRECEIFGFKEFEKKRIKNERESIRRMSLIQRAELQKPRIPPLLTRSSALAQSSKLIFADSTLSARARQKKERSIRIAEFIQQKREIYIIQLLIDRKNQEMEKIFTKINSAEKSLVERDEQIEIDSGKIKLANAKNEARLAHARRKMEAAIRKKVALQRSLKTVQGNVTICQSEIFKNEDQLEAFHMYEVFLKMMTPEGQDVFKHFSNPDVLLNELQAIEQGNLNLIQDCQYYEELVEKGLLVLKDEESTTTTLIDSVQDQFKKLETVNELPSDFGPSYVKNFHSKDQELIKLTQLVERTYINCFGIGADVTPIAMLERIENQLEQFYKKMESIDTQFAQSRQMQKDRQRRERQRREKQERQEAEQKIKMEQALERANKPIKKNNGRPLLPRSVLRKHEQRTDLKLLRELKEQQQFEELLYGSPYDGI